MGEVGEFGLIARVAARLPRGDATLLGPGDDAAVVAAPDGRVVVTTDVLVEGVHFRRDWSSGDDVGRKAAAANLADVVAMGAVPTALVVALTAPGDLSVGWAEDLADGLAAGCAACGAATGTVPGVVGGDTSRGPLVSVAVTALGDLGGAEPVLRSGARPGDVVVLAGHPGWSAAGLALLRGPDPASLSPEGPPLAWSAEAPGPAAPRAVRAHLAPEPAYAAALALARGGATSLCDVSDGLVADLGHIAAASGVAVDLDPDALRPEAALADLAEGLGADPSAWVLTGGEDHAFAGTLPAGAPLPLGCTAVGVVTGGAGVTVGGRPWAGAGGHRHF